ncbi:hypothetical protein I7I50_09771 [Histoplasma capsulatum G186AR]|uniref:Uncharacterized protein n=1 Tax=Ajellomyces capsulatus TaxID=5037 RepID=A0A8H7Z335_AJECA|nr:hypothetical protein I7I52_10912 [Histoplasma capsulatum]QSS68711.1 hypothetical protein I7I50_09771 [Histoplasma capsulatum G186AR]
MYPSRHWPGRLGSWSSMMTEIPMGMRCGLWLGRTVLVPWQASMTSLMRRCLVRIGLRSCVSFARVCAIA